MDMVMSDVLESNGEYIAIGSLVILTNFLVLMTLSSTKKLVAKYQMFTALAFAHIIGGCGSLAAGYGRILIYSQNFISNHTTIADCMLAPWIPLTAIGGQWPAVIVLAIGFERCLAVFKPIFYRKTFNNVLRGIIIIASATILICVLLCAYADRIVFGDMEQIITPGCFNTDTFAPIFNDFHRAVIVLGNLGGFCLSLVATLFARHQSKTAGAYGTQMRQESQRIKLLLAISAFSVLLATVPQLLFWISSHGLFSFPLRTNYIISIAFYSSSLINLLIHLQNKEFRTRFLWLISAGKYCSAEAEVSVAPSASPIRHR